MVEIIRPQRAIVVFGGGHDVEAVDRLASSVGWRVDVFTTRDPVPLDGYDAAIVMTHNFPRDAELLPRLLQSSIPYIGLLGPKSRGEELLAGRTDPRVHAPIGLDLGSETPEEIALSIVAEMQAVFARRSARPLRDVDVPIHERVVAIVLAAGSSSRLGRPKQDVVFDGETLLARATRVAREVADEVIVVTRENNRDADEGMASSIRYGVARAGHARVLITLCDQPLVTADHLRALIAVRAPIVASGYDGIAGVPAVFAPELHADLLALRGDTGARQLIATRGAVVVPFGPAAVDVDVQECGGLPPLS